MNPTAKDLKAELAMDLALLESIRDEIRVKVHLAGMDAKDRWKKLEPQLAPLEQAAKDIEKVSQAAVKDAVAALKQFRESLTHGTPRS